MRLRLLMLASAFVLALTPVGAHAGVKLSSIFGDGMVLQRDKPIPVWGMADADEEVTVTFAGATQKAKADADGKWRVNLPAKEANAKGQTLTISGKDKIEIKDVLIGEVWLGSGQSNMEWSLTASADPAKTIAAADHPMIRLFHVPHVKAKEPAFTVNAKWETCSPKTVGRFSAVMYHFGVELQSKLNVPIGLVHPSWGGSPIEEWIVEGKTSGSMYNAMVAPLMPYAIRGILWYQGESNIGQGFKYRDKMETLITGWRNVWGKETPFYFVQIAPFSGYGKTPLAELWEAQVASLKIPHTGMAVTTDIVHNIGDIHPKNKQDVGKRLALWAFAKTYSIKDVVYSGPLYKGMKVEDGKLRLEFAHVGDGLVARDGKALSEFEIAGEDGKFVPAEAVIDGKTIVVSAKDVAKPTQARYGWSNTANPNLMNKEGLPASPFRTKDWKGGTGE